LALYERFIDGIPWYLARYYWWAYLWKRSIWFFDHQPIINAILFGQYQRLMEATLARYRPEAGDRVLQLTCVYGKLTPTIAASTPAGLHIMDACTAQLELAQRKCAAIAAPLYAARMNAESLGYAPDSFDHVILFFLLHEMPPEARANVYDDMLRVTRPGGTILITEYGTLPTHHWLYRFAPFRWLLGRLEPFLPGFWHEDLDAKLIEAADRHGKHIERIGEDAIFSGFYRVVAYRVLAESENMA